MSVKFLIWGGNGWIGSMLRKILEEQKYIVITAKSRLQDYMGILKELDEINPDFVLNCAGITGRPTVDWCEDHKQDTYLINTIGVVNLADACWRRKCHLTYYATGCIYMYDKDHPIGGSLSKFSELDLPNFRGSTYSKSKIYSEELLKHYDNVLILRIRMPISENLHPKNLITKLIKYPKVVNIPNSITILSEMLPISVNMTLSKLTGIYNFTNPGAISHNEILTLYKRYVDPNFVWENFTEDEQSKILKSQRSNCELDITKLIKLYPITEIHEAIVNVMQNIK